MNKIKLPFDSAAGWNYEVNLEMMLGILKPNLTSFDVWLCEHLINVTYAPQNPIGLNFYTPNHWNDDAHCLRTSFIKVDPSVFRDDCLDLIETVCRSLENSLYVRGLMDAFYIPTNRFHGKAHHSGTFLLLGFDREREIFHAFGDSSEPTLSEFEIPFENFEAAVMGKRTELNFIHVLSGKNTPDMDILKRDLKQYLTSDTGVKLSYNTGIWCWEELGRIIRYTHEYRIKVNEKHIQFLQMSKAFMGQRMEYLFGAQKDYAAKAMEVNDLAGEVARLAKEYNESGNGGLLVTADKCLKDIISLEKDYMGRILMS